MSFIMICVILTLMVLACFILDNSDDNNYKYQEVYMKIKRIQIKAYYSYCSICGRSVDSDDLYYYGGLCADCWRSRYYE